MEKYKSETGKTPTIIVDDMHYALKKDAENTEVFLSYCSAAFDEGTFNSVFLGSGRISEKIDELNVPGLRARLKKTEFVSRDLEKIEEPLANFLSVIFGENPKNDAASITPDALRPLANDLLTVLGPRYLDLQELHRATSPADAKGIVVDLIKKKSGATWRNVGPGSICRALVESDDGMFIDKDGKFVGDEPLKCKNADGMPSDLETLQLVRRDEAADEKNNFKKRFRPHHGAAFAAMAKLVRDEHPEVKLGKSAVGALAVYDRLVDETKDHKK
eukprot:CAMPEP_0118897024 /NCGR_PEP_ID=MMETSP1166-20130328/4604_1 /TAXON_ID=1104430 /ORGANISM="Chrysoreinhardia sp, Strain CCMP3193" /LENGTH=273 /DNA_ID=CAMNT_0006836085 /DNA_START=8 /DNA_END=829 /DNA_ORIENTATION=-